jgi:glycosyltransferase involved in cell wall biosynthesis
MSDIKISIIIPCYNREDYIEECLRSVISQTYQNKEILLIDNESTDQSLEIAKKIQTEHPEIIIEECPNIYAHSWQDPVEKGISISTGEYFTIVGSDDLMEPTYIENVMKYIAVNPEKISFFQSPMIGIDENGAEVGEVLSHSYKDLEEFKEQLFLKQPVNTPTVIYKTKLFYEGVIKWESEEYLGAIDYDSFFRIAHHGHFIYPARNWLGYYYRWNQSQLTWVMHQQEQNYDEKIQNYWRSCWNSSDT